MVGDVDAGGNVLFGESDGCLDALTLSMSTGEYEASGPA